MRLKLFFLGGIFLLFSSGIVEAASQDNVYGEYLLSTSKKKISMDLEGASLIDVLKVLSQQTGLNFVASEAVKGRTLTLYLEKVPLKEALDTIFKANNLTYEFYPESNVFIVKEMGKPTLELETKVYYLKYASVKSSPFYKEIGEALGSGGGEGILEAVKKVLSEYGRAVEDARTNSLVVTDVPSQFPLIDKVILALDKPVPQVMIEVEMLDVKKELVDKLGLEFINGVYAKLAGGSRTTSFPVSTVSTPSIRGGDLFPKSSVTLGTLSFDGFQIALQFLTKDVSTKYLARPKILTLSDQTAEIKLSTNEAVSVVKSYNAQSPGEVSYTVEREETGVILRVTPHVSPDTREITMLVEPRVASAENTGYSFQDYTVKDVHNRSTKSVVRIKESQTLMIGGLLRSDSSDSRTKAPFLGDVPLLGALFRNRSKSSEERELLVFLTPRIVSSEAETNLAKIVLREDREQTDSKRSYAIDEALAKFE